MKIYVGAAEENFKLEFENTAKLFAKTEDVVVIKENQFDEFLYESRNEKFITIIGRIKIVNDKKWYEVIYRGLKDSKELLKPFHFVPEDSDFLENKRKLKWLIRRFLFKSLLTETNKYLPWGMLNGIRPAKFAMDLINEGGTRESVISDMINNFWVKEDKAALLYDIALKEKAILDNAPQKTVGLYIGIPFCPSRCLYCSFTAEPISKHIKKVPEYIDALGKEMAATKAMLSKQGLKVQSIYIGGGTPTSLDENSLKCLIDMTKEHFISDSLEEFTIEAGRPDSLNHEKLKIIKESCVTRISINPQTINDKTLEIIGRNHSAEQFIKAYEMAKKMGFENINTDIIIGLPGETLEMFDNTMKAIEKLSPDSLTVHTLAIKRASKLKQDIENYEETKVEVGQLMMEKVYEYTDTMGLSPYYLYRQKNMLGHLENTGFCKEGKECIYNVQIMEEVQSIVALGAGAVTKIVFPNENRIERAFNVKNVDEYINRIDEMIERKRLLFETI